jgi:hypothetical protein
MATAEALKVCFAPCKKSTNSLKNWSLTMAEKYRIVRGYEIDGKTHWVKVGTMKRPKSGLGWSITLYHTDVRFMAYPDEEKQEDGARQSKSRQDHQAPLDDPLSDEIPF